jgi:Cdc6-like AAA superfamily ATPase
MEETKEPLREPFKLEEKEAVEIFESLLHVFSSREHLIVGRNEEEQVIKQFIDDNIKQDVTGLLYVCGHPGQGKTAVVNQVLFDYFGDLDSSFGGINDNLFILKYNGMRYATPNHFVESLLADLNILTAKSNRRNFIKSLTMLDSDTYKGSLPSA